VVTVEADSLLHELRQISDLLFGTRLVDFLSVRSLSPDSVEQDRDGEARNAPWRRVDLGDGAVDLPVAGARVARGGVEVLVRLGLGDVAAGVGQVGARARDSSLSAALVPDFFRARLLAPQRCLVRLVGLLGLLACRRVEGDSDPNICTGRTDDAFELSVGFGLKGACDGLRFLDERLAADAAFTRARPVKSQTFGADEAHAVSAQSRNSSRN
jgi:hypothetical protein